MSQQDPTDHTTSDLSSAALFDRLLDKRDEELMEFVDRPRKIEAVANASLDGLRKAIRYV